MPPQLFVVPARDAPDAVILRRGPAGQVATLGWNRDSDEIVMGQWFKGRIYEHRCDLSPDGRHFIYFAGKGGAAGWWTAISRAPWLHALHVLPQSSTWHGGGAFTAPGRYWQNGGEGPAPATDEIAPCGDPAAFPHSTDGFWMGDLFATRMAAQGWAREGTGYDVVLRKRLAGGWTLRWWIETGQPNRALVAGRYALDGPGGRVIVLPDWDWADLWDGELRVAEKGQLKAVAFADGRLEERRVVHDFRDMAFRPIRAPYDSGAQQRAGR